MLYPIIIAGGQGTRLWPVSRRKSPKQIRPFLNGKTLLNKTYGRLLKIVPKEQIFLSTTKELADEAKRETPGILEEHVLSEPVRRDTAAALGLALFKLYKKDKDSVFVYINADNFVKNEDEYARILKSGEKVIEENPHNVLLIGVRPEYPETGYGYIEFDGDVVKSFVEKPEHPKSTLVSTGCYLFQPHHFPKIIAYAKNYPDHLGSIFEWLINKGEKIDVFSFDDPWFDIGSFESYLQAEEALLPGQLVSTSSMVESSTLGKTVEIRDRTRISNSTLERCIIFEDCVIKNSNLRSCVIDQGCHIEGVDLTQKMIRAGTMIKGS